jgi:putative heme transporter
VTPESVRASGSAAPDALPPHDHGGHIAPFALDDTIEPPDPALAVEHELHRKSPQRRAVEALVSLAALVVLFALVIPKVSGATYSRVVHQLHHLSIAQIGLLAAVWLIGLVVYAGVLTASLPGLRHGQGFVLNTASSAVSNVVPFGGAVGVGATYGMCRSWGFGVPKTTLGILVSGIWNVFLKLGLPVIALVLLVAEGRASQELVGAAIFGLATLVASVLVLTLVLRSDRLATVVGQGLQRLSSAVLRLARRPDRPGVEEAVLDFRHRSSGLISRRWPRLTFWMLSYSMMQFVLQLLCLRLLGEHSLSTIQVFAAFAFGRLLSTVPITPSGVGFADATVIGALVAFGGNPEVCTAGVLLFTGFTYLLEIPVGGVSWIVWSRVKGWRRAVVPDAA